MENQKEEKKAEDKKQTRSVKNKIIIAALVVVGFLIGWEIGIYSYMRYIRPYYSGMDYRNYVDAYIQLQLNDRIGGDTPEQTMDLFIDALKKGDYDLASKYFVIDEQEKWRKNFETGKRENIEEWVIELEKYKKIWRAEYQGEKQFVIKYNIGTGEEERTNFIVLEKNVNNKWKIGSF